jgi:cytoskeletal protein CcmA (bactofilin family)
MFSKSDDKSRVDPPGLGEPFRRASGAAVPSLISADLKVVGNLESDGDLQVDGQVKGDIKSRGITVGEGATIKGSITADTLRISGAVDGTVSGTSVTISKTGKVKGDIVHQTLSIEAGATIEGQVRRLDSERPKIGAKPATAPSAEAGPATVASNGGGDKPAAG